MSIRYHWSVLKARIFIGSSGDARQYAEAIHAKLAVIAECTVWTEGAFRLAESTLANLMRNLQDSDFGIFVFAPDDLATIKGDLFKVTRDNVVFEAGLFAGYLSATRCFIAAPMTEKVHLPTDLAGITVGFYEDTRTDRNYQAAVAPFCNEVQSQIRGKPPFGGHIPRELFELMVKAECCDWIPDDGKLNDPSAPRVNCKRQVVGEIDTFLKYGADSVNKHRLLQQHRLGSDLALLRTIRSKPSSSDWKLLTEMATSRLKPGFSQFLVLDAVEALQKAGKLNTERLKHLLAWLHDLPGLAGDIKARVEALTL